MPFFLIVCLHRLKSPHCPCSWFMTCLCEQVGFGSNAQGRGVHHQGTLCFMCVSSNSAAFHGLHFYSPPTVIVFSRPTFIGQRATIPAVFFYFFFEISSFFPGTGLYLGPEYHVFDPDPGSAREPFHSPPQNKSEEAITPRPRTFTSA